MNRGSQNGWAASWLFTLAALASLWLLLVSDAEAAQVPERIVSLGPLNTENIFLLGAGDRLVGVTVYCVRPEVAKEKPKVGTLMGLDIERIVALRPDLVVATALTPEAQVAKLRSLGLRVERFGQPRTFDDICRQFLRLGELLGLEERAASIVAETRRAVECIGAAVSNLPPRRVFLQVGADPIFASVPGSFTHDFIRIGGGVNIAQDQRDGLIGQEKVLAKDPEVIIIAIMGSETGMAARERSRWLRFSSLSAVQQHRIHTVSPDLVCSPSPVTFVEALALVAGLIHPEAKAEIDACIPSRPMLHGTRAGEAGQGRNRPVP